MAKIAYCRQIIAKTVAELDEAQGHQSGSLVNYCLYVLARDYAILLCRMRTSTPCVFA